MGPYILGYFLPMEGTVEEDQQVEETTGGAGSGVVDGLEMPKTETTIKMVAVADEATTAGRPISQTNS